MNLTMTDKLDEKYYLKQPEFTSILRIQNTNIDGNRKVAFGLSQIRGIGRRFAQAVVRVSNIDPELRIGMLSSEEIEELEEIMKEPVKHGIPKWMVNRQKDRRTGEYRQVLANDLAMVTKLDIDRMKRIRSWKGIRHMYGLKVRGQHTRTTGRSGLVVGFVRKEQKQLKKKKKE